MFGPMEAPWTGRASNALRWIVTILLLCPASFGSCVQACRLHCARLRRATPRPPGGRMPGANSPSRATGTTRWWGRVLIRSAPSIPCPASVACSFTLHTSRVPLFLRGRVLLRAILLPRLQYNGSLALLSDCQARSLPRDTASVTSKRRWQTVCCAITNSAIPSTLYVLQVACWAVTHHLSPDASRLPIPWGIVRCWNGDPEC
ncbi:hypothetical protein B0I35DRAFT_190508 [Stachybotrys elegans]|uniref:Secreted protein n=1 Tax=Stachybotrys elegans TaxID=80388 RepID=A0A8K0SWI7_9HYPO|nr:hypothetical protein B0I35DRAFT_190508 [Stachybotrys elegans]